jgi:hypothetical protein
MKIPSAAVSAVLAVLLLGTTVSEAQVAERSRQSGGGVEIGAPGNTKDAYEQWADIEWVSPGSAYGIVIRPAYTEGRFMVAVMKGFFRPDAEVSIFDPQGRPVAKGKVKSVYDDSIYVDVSESAASFVNLGYVVGMNVSDAEARDLILASPQVIRSVKADVRKEKEAAYLEAKRDYREDQRIRNDERFQYKMRRMELDFMYNWWWYWW